MKIVEIPLDRLTEAPWNPNQADKDEVDHLRASIKKYGLVQNLVVRPIGKGLFEVLSGNQRFKFLKEAGIPAVPCVVVKLDDANARLLAQALNHIHGEDDLGLRAEVMRKVLETIPKDDILAVLPETADGLSSLASMGQETIATYLHNWQQAQPARLRHLQFQLTTSQLEVIEEAIARIMPQVSQMQRDNPNLKGNALYLLCKDYLEHKSR